MLGGKRPFGRPSSAETLSALIRDEPTPIAALNPDVPVPLRWILERCLSKDPAGRYASTQDLARELRTLLEHLPEATPIGDRPATAQTGSASRRVAQPVTSNRLAIGAVATVLLILLAAGFYLFGVRGALTSIDSLAVLPFINAGGDPQTE